MANLAGTFSIARGDRRALSVILGIAVTILVMIPSFVSAQETESVDSVAASRAGLPFKAVFSATSTVEEDGRRCPGGLKATVRGTGLATQLGKFTTLQTHCINPATDPFGFTRGIYQFTAEDGSTITGQYGGRIVPTTTSNVDGQFYVDAVFSITRGTGRLRGAQGGGGASGLLTPSTGDSNVVLDGHITFPPR
jgi:hypothetical protein